MKIAITLLSGGIINRGAEHSMLMLAEDLVDLGHQVTVFQAGPKNPKASYNTIVVPLPSVPTSKKPTSFFGKILERLYLNHRGILTLLFSFKIKSQLRSFDAIIPTDGFWSVLCAQWGRKKGAKIICVGLAGMGWTDQDTLRLKPDIFVALSTVAQRWAKNINPHVRVVMIPLQVDIGLFLHAPPLLPRRSNPIILTVAALTKYKRVDVLVKAVAKIPHCMLLIVGQGEEYERIHALCEKLLPKRYLIKQVDFDVLPSIYRTAGVFALLSEPQEAFGQVLVEAMAAEMPIVTTDDPIRREIVGDPGIYVDPTDQASIITGLTQALEKKYEVYDVKRFNKQTVAKQYEQLCQS